MASGDLAVRKPKHRPCFHYSKTGSCPNGDSCRYVHSRNGSSTSSVSDETHAMNSESTVIQNHPKLSSSDARKVENVKAKTEEMQAYLSGAAKWMGNDFKIGKFFMYVQIPLVEMPVAVFGICICYATDIRIFHLSMKLNHYWQITNVW